MPVNALRPVLSATLAKSNLAGMLTAGAALFAVTCAITPAQAQIYQLAGISQADLSKAPRAQQMSVLARLLKDANQGACVPTAVSMKSLNKEGGGFWVVRCNNGHDFLVLVPADAGKGGVAMSCTLAKVMAKQDCYSGS